MIFLGRLGKEIPLAEIGNSEALTALRVLKKDPASEVAQLAQNILLWVNANNTEIF